MIMLLYVSEWFIYRMQGDGKGFVHSITLSIKKAESFSSHYHLICKINDITNEQRRSTMTEHLTAESFRTKIFDFEKNKEWKYEGTLPALIDFWAPWCGPCRMVGPVIDELSKEYEGKVNFYKVNTDEEQELSAAFGIRSIPSLLFITVKGEPKMSMGALPKKELKNIIDRELLAPLVAAV
jgi:thioredoxin